MTRLHRVALGIGSLALMAALLVGVPAALVRFVGNPLPTALPSWERATAALTAGRVDPKVVISLLTVLVWLVWGQLAIALVAEVAATLRGRGAPRLPVAPGVQRLAMQMVASASLLLSTFTPARPVLAADLSTLAAPPPAVASMAGEPVVADPGLDLVTVATPTVEEGQLYAVRRGDSLWTIAERTLGDGTAWQQIRDLNAGRAQPDGSRLPDDFVENLRPGWTLLLPEGAAPSPVPGTTYTVVAGDSLSRIAQAAYGDPATFPEVFAANEGRTQPDGRTLSDPDVIRPDWLLDLPAAPGDSARITAPPSRPSVPEPTDVEPQPLPDEQAVPTPPPAARPTPAPAPARPADVASDPVGTGTEAPAEDDSKLIAPAAVSAAALVAGSLLWTLARLRARQSRRRRPGRDLPQPAPELVEVERRLRSEAADQPLAWLDATLRLLTVRLRERPARPPAGVPLALQAGADGVEVLLSQPDEDPPDGFSSTDGGYAWRLDTALTLEELQEAAGDAPPIAPATVTLGRTLEGPLLVNLEHLALLRVQGPSEPVQAFLSGLAVELTTAPWASGVTVHPVVEGDDPLVRLPGVEAAASLDDLAPHLQAVAQATRSAIGGEDTALARITPDAEDWPPTVVILRDAATASDTVHAVMEAAQQPGSGLALVVAGEVDGDIAWRLQLRDDGTATLEPLGIEVAVSGLDLEVTEAAAELLDLATAEDISRPVSPSDRDLDLDLEREPDDDELPVSLDPLPVEVAVLGPVTVSGWENPDVRSQLVEVVAYLAVQGRPVPTDTLRTALWPEGINYSTFKNVISRTRKALGMERSSTYHLPESREGRYGLGPDVGCDWTRFQALATAAKVAAPPRALSLLVTALALVKGRPFDSTTSGTYQWAFDEQVVSAIEVAVVDAASRVADLALDADDPDLAIWATRQGHLVVPDHEGLYRARMHAYAQTGDLDAIHQTFRETLRAARAYDPLDDVQPETQRLYREFTRQQQTAPRG